MFCMRKAVNIFRAGILEGLVKPLSRLQGKVNVESVNNFV